MIIAGVVPDLVPLRSVRDVTVYDSRFRILDHCISLGTNHTIYNGSQIEGRIRATAKYKFGLKVNDLSSVSVGLDKPHLAFLIRYMGDLPFEELDGLKAQLTNDKDISIDLGMGVKRYDQQKNTFIRCYGLPDIPTSDDSLIVNFRIASSNKPVATWNAGSLSKYNKQLNANRLAPAD